MPRIPYVFRAIPDEFLTEDFLNDLPMIRLIVWMMKRISTNSNYIPLKNSSKQLLLEPFEFMFGRDQCARDANISSKNVRTRLKQLIGLGYIEEIENKKARTYSVYRLVTTAFRQNSGQQQGQQSGNENGHPVGHKRKTEFKKDKSIKEASNVKPVDKSLLSDKQNEDLAVLLAYCENKNLLISEFSLVRWIFKYEIDRLIEHLALLNEEKKKVKNHEAWLETALKENYAWKNCNIQKNREFAQRFKEHNQWSELHLTKNYCTHNRSSKDFQYNLPVHVFQKMLQECFEQYKGMDY
jgi:hypothetical protein